MKTDRKHRQTKARVDGAARRDLVDSARNIIYNMARPVNSDKVEFFLKDQSYVPTEVGYFTIFIAPFSLHFVIIECILRPNAVNF